MEKDPNNSCTQRLVAIPIYGRKIYVLPMDVERDFPELYLLSNGSEINNGSLKFPRYDPKTIWRFILFPVFHSESIMKETYLKETLDNNKAVFTVFDLKNNQPIGSLEYMDISPQHLSVEIGKVWITPPYQRSGYCTEAVQILIDHCFSQGYRRILWKCRKLNETSRNFIEKLGFTLEIIADDHVIHDGAIFDVCMYSLFRS